MSRSIWKILGVAASASHDDVRRAYARKLRVTNPEDDPQGFIALRAAYEQALKELKWRAQWAASDAEDGEEEGTDADESFDYVQDNGEFAPEKHVLLDVPDLRIPRTPPQPAREPTPEERADAESRAAFAAHKSGLIAALKAAKWDGGAAANEHLRAMLHSPEMLALATRDTTEYWLAQIILAHLPRADAIMEQADSTFGWRTDVTYRPKPYPISGVIGRFQEWAIIENLGRASNPHHGAWRALTAANQAGWHRRLNALNQVSLAARVSELLNKSRYDSPGLKHHFAPAALKWWEAYLAQPQYTVKTLLLAPLSLGLVIWLMVYPALMFPHLNTNEHGFWTLVAFTLVVPALMSPWLYFKFVKRKQFEHDDDDFYEREVGWRYRLAKQGWIFGLFALVIGAIALPPSETMMWLLTLLAYALIIWMEAAK